MTTASSSLVLWRIDLSPNVALLSSCRALLNDEERARAARLLPERAADFDLTRGMVRLILADATKSDPACVEFRASPQGKLSLTNSSLHFSIAHTVGLALLAVCPAHEVGVDLEKMRPVSWVSEIADRYFPAAEATLVREAAPEEAARLFFTSWTRREALLKAAGTGLAALSEIRALALPTGLPVSFRGRRWWLHALEPAPGYLGALAVDAPDLTIVRRAAEELL